MSNVLEWKETTDRIGPTTYYGYWDGAKCFSVFTPLAIKAPTAPKHTPTAKYQIKSILPGFRPDLPLQNSVAEAQAFCERMLERWVAKRGLIFKERIIVTDAMKQAAFDALTDAHGFQNPATPAYLGPAIEAAIKAREPHAASNTVQNRTAKKR